MLEETILPMHHNIVFEFVLCSKFKEDWPWLNWDTSSFSIKDTQSKFQHDWKAIGELLKIVGYISSSKTIIPWLERWLCGLWHLWVRVRFLALRWFTITCNSRGSNVLFWPMWALIHSWNTHTQNNSNDNNNNNNNVIASIPTLMHLGTLSFLQPEKQ